MYSKKDVMRINNIKSLYCQQQDKKLYQCQKSLMHGSWIQKYQISQIQESQIDCKHYKD